ncbi:MAG TPA: SHOCT domain-containing protein [Acidimicrobiales bacterium]|nr:SHOCT domain-containing protein [Acidimicrobiales bacterium]
MMRRRGGLVRGVARTAVVAGTATAVSGRVRRRQDAKWSEQEQAEYEQQMAQQPAPAPAPAGDAAELQQLADLHAQGILTDEEFAAKKAQILGI